MLAILWLIWPPAGHLRIDGLWCGIGWFGRAATPGLEPNSLWCGKLRVFLEMDVKPRDSFFSSLDTVAMQTAHALPLGTVVHRNSCRNDHSYSVNLRLLRFKYPEDLTP